MPQCSRGDEDEDDDGGGGNEKNKRCLQDQEQSILAGCQWPMQPVAVVPS